MWFRGRRTVLEEAKGRSVRCGGGDLCGMTMGNAMQRFYYSDGERFGSFRGGAGWLALFVLSSGEQFSCVCLSVSFFRSFHTAPVLLS